MLRNVARHPHMTQILHQRSLRENSSHLRSCDRAEVFPGSVNACHELQYRLPILLDDFGLSVSMVMAASWGVIFGSVSSLVLVAIVVIVLLRWPIYLAVH